MPPCHILTKCGIYIYLLLLPAAAAAAAAAAPGDDDDDGGNHYSDVITGAMASEITGVSIVCSSVGLGADQRNHQSSLSLAFVRGIHRWPVNSPHKGPVTRKMFPFGDVIMSPLRWPTFMFIFSNRDLMCKICIVERIFLLISCLYSCFCTLPKFSLVFSSHTFLLWNGLFQISILYCHIP